MRHLRNTLYIFTEDAYATLDGENIVVKQSGREMGRVPLHTLEAIFCFSYMGGQSCADGHMRRERNRPVVLHAAWPFPSAILRRSTGQCASAEETIRLVGIGGTVSRRGKTLYCR